MNTKIITLTLALISLFTVQNSKAQMTAMNFNIMDCNNTGPHNLFNDLNSGQVVIVEYFMTSCSPCITAGQTLESMKANLLSQYPGKIKAYAFGFNNSYSCNTVNNWVTTNGFTSIPSDSGATQVAYYGGMGMPTIIIAAGTSHNLLGNPYVGFTTGDTTQMAANIRNFLNSQPTGLNESSVSVSGLNIFPNPATSEVNIKFFLKENSDVEIDVLDVTGRVVSNLFFEKTQAGAYVKTFNTNGIANGNYIVRVKANGSVSNQKLNIVH